MHFAGEGFGRERLLKKSRAGFKHTVMADDLVRVTGNVEHFDIGSNRLDGLGKLPPAHLGHHNVGYQGMDRTGILLRDE